MLRRTLTGWALHAVGEGVPITVPTQDLVLGLYYLTKAKVGAKGEGRVFANIEEVLMALEAGAVETGRALPAEDVRDALAISSDVPGSWPPN